MSESIIVLGIMSGSSLDGIDMAWIRFPVEYRQHSEPNAEWMHTEFYAYPDEWKIKLAQADRLRAPALFKLHVDYARLQAEVIEDYENPEHKADLIAWHGHTIFHDPLNGYSFQLGKGEHLAELTKRIVINDFRNSDIAKGGQGAPLAPIVDQNFFQDHRYLINLGGICNMTINGEKPVAFDICGCNQVLNYLASQKGWAYDEDGKLSQQGVLNKQLLKDLDRWDYLKQSFPKSLSNQNVQNFYLPLLDSWEIPVEDKMKTFIHHVCDNILQWVESEYSGKSLLLSGGGARNHTIAQLLEKKYAPGVSIMDPKWLEYKEAFLMAYMGYLRWQEIPNVLSSVTGSSEDHSAGIIHHPS